MSKFLATIDRDVDIDFDFEKTTIELPDIAKATEFLRKMQFYSFLKNIEFILKSFNKSDNCKPQAEVQIPQTGENGQLGLFAQAVAQEINKVEFEHDIKIITDSTDFENLINELKNTKVFSLKFFADIMNAVNIDLYGIAIGINDSLDIADNKLIAAENGKTKVYYLPFAHGIQNKLDIQTVINSLKFVFENENIKKITHDSKTDINILKNYGSNLNGIAFDTMLASYIKDSSANNSFDIQCMERIEHILPTMVSDNKKAKFCDFGIENVKNYVAETICAHIELAKYWLKNLDDKELILLYSMEIPLAYVLSDMETNGVTVDVNYLHKLTDEMNGALSNIEGRIYDIAGEPFNINSPKQVGHILFEKLKIESPKKRGKNKNSTNAEILNYLAYDNEIAQLILDYRQYAKLKSTYTEALPALIDCKDGRIHTTYNQTVTTTGRLSSSNPNLQNIPIRTAEGNRIRKAFIPSDRENYLIMSADYSQIELRLLAHVSKDHNLIEAFKSGIDVHTLTASKVFDVSVDEVTKDMRRKAKAVNFGIVYGQTKYGLAKALQIMPQEAENFINKYFETYPNVKIYMDTMVEIVEKQGFVETISGRKRYLEEQINSSNGMIREFAKRAAINHPMQGSASDLIKTAMIVFANKLKENNLKSKLIMQVHDELVVEVEKTELETVTKLIKESMELGQPLLVPLELDINTGDSWKES